MHWLPDTELTIIAILTIGGTTPCIRFVSSQTPRRTEAAMANITKITATRGIAPPRRNGRGV